MAAGAGAAARVTEPISSMNPIGQRDHCDNRNHSRVNPPVRNCPQCGGVVNQQLGVKQCSETEHASLRRTQNHFCINCGAQLIVAR